jgi:hypothetical protein
VGCPNGRCGGSMVSWLWVGHSMCVAGDRSCGGGVCTLSVGVGAGACALVTEFGGGAPLECFGLLHVGVSTNSMTFFSVASNACDTCLESLERVSCQAVLDDCFKFLYDSYHSI